LKNITLAREEVVASAAIRDGLTVAASAVGGLVAAGVITPHPLH